MRASCALVVAALGACRPDLEDCDWPVEPRPPAAAEGEIHPELRALAAYRHYLAVTEVGPFAHHFSINYRCIEPTWVHVAAWRGDDGEPEVEFVEGYWGGLGVAPADDPPPLPRELDDLVEAIEDLAPGGARDLQIRYVGEHREVTVVELRPTAPLAGDAPLIARTTAATFAADEALTKLSSITGRDGGFGLFCAGLLDCAAAPHWLDLRPPPRDQPYLAADAVDLPQGWEGEALRVAKEVADGAAPSVTIAALSDDDGLLPAGITQVLHMRPEIFARDHDDFSRQRSVSLPLSVATAGLLSGAPQRVRTSGFVAGIVFTIEAIFTADNPPPAGFIGEADLEVSLAIEAWDDRGERFSGDFVLRGGVLVDDGDAAAASLAPTGGGLDSHTFAGHDEFDAFDLYVHPGLSGL